MITLEDVLSVSEDFEKAINDMYLCDASPRFKKLWNEYTYQIIQQAKVFVKEQNISADIAGIGTVYLFETTKSDVFRRDLRIRFLNWWISKLQNESTLCQSCELEEGNSEHSYPMAEMRGDSNKSFCNCCSGCTGNCNDSV